MKRRTFFLLLGMVWPLTACGPDESAPERLAFAVPDADAAGIEGLAICVMSADGSDLLRVSDVAEDHGLPV